MRFQLWGEEVKNGIEGEKLEKAKILKSKTTGNNHADLEATGANGTQMTRKNEQHKAIERTKWNRNCTKIAEDRVTKIGIEQQNTFFGN